MLHGALCRGAYCDATDVSACCTSRQRCSPSICNEGRMIVSSDVLCGGPLCTDRDASVCCTPRQPCAQSAGICSENEVIIQDAFCRGSRCSAHIDHGTCCMPSSELIRYKQGSSGGGDFDANVNDKIDASVLAGTSKRSAAATSSSSSSTSVRAGMSESGSIADVSNGVGADARSTGASGSVGFGAAAFSIVNGSTATLGQPCGAGQAAIGACGTTQVLLLAAKCRGPKCTAGDKDICCAERGLCSTTREFGGICADFESLIEDAHCRAPLCSKDDRDVCCTSRQLCTSASLQLCSPSHLEVVLEGVYCAGNRCTTADRPTCCGKRETCGVGRSSLHMIIPCNDTHVFQPDLLCRGTRCGASDAALCCVARQRCESSEFANAATFKSLCGEQQVFFPEGVCKSTKCTIEDRDVCCSERQLCSTHFADKCENSSHALASGALCRNQKCTLEDARNCCVERQSCGATGAMALGLCTDRQVLQKERRCRGEHCTILDHATCCVERESCHSGASSKTLDRTLCEVKGLSFEPTVLCPGSRCVPEDITACCTVKERCVSALDLFKGVCDGPELVLGGLCRGPRCTREDVDVCCGKRQHCGAGLSNTDCEPPKVLLPHELCSGTKCTLDDTDTCCVRRARCGDPSLTLFDGKGMAGACSPTQTLQTLAECRGATCGPEDADVCCAERPRCDSTPGLAALCGTGSIFDPKAPCQSENCRVEHCCVKREPCIGHLELCSGKEILIPNALCLGKDCTDADARNCCTDRQRCDVGFPAAGTCPPESIFKHDGICEGEQCTLQDVAACCVLRELCEDARRANPQWAADLCRGQEDADGSTDAREVLAWNKADGMRCGGPRCTDEDRDVCCQKASRRHLKPSLSENQEEAARHIRKWLDDEPTPDADKEKKNRKTIHD
eukprot:gnl/TRDRNA2_/TRDRNA2_152457_c1_seq1.p1 gnl/TRDRNA2_/TRDRNA2_152457_c1~~gnl/TRDRNA2_/TRDRNA2_152457_c1_seq1.p1  ORF type:complete len:1063 (+),score=122.51 gnl/TRDRNA2_/TRDRNA2_152457_c1_seq1:472-3189(+)